MNKASNRIWSLGLVLIMIATLLSGCAGGESATEPAAQAEQEAGTLHYEGELVFNGDEVSFSIPYNEIYEREPVTREVHHISSSGEESTNQVTGVVLGELLAEKGISQGDYSSVRFTAADGYAIDMPQEILAAKDVILAYEFDGEVLNEKKLPLRVAVDGERSMYYVSNLASIEFFKSDVVETEVEANERKIVLLETAASAMPSEVFTYYENEDQAILMADLTAAYCENMFAKVRFVASDGFEKIESADVINQGFLKINGEDAPLFTGRDLPKGMNVKSVTVMEAADTTFVSAAQAMTLLGEFTTNEKTGVCLADLIGLAGLEADYLVLAANDGYSVEVPKTALKDGVVYVNSDGTNTVKFAPNYPKNTKIKNLLTIEAGDGSNAIVVENGGEEAKAEKEEAAVVGSDWEIEFSGLSDGSFTFTSDRAERKLERMALHTERIKNDEVKADDWEGYKVLDVLDFLHVDTFESLTIVAGDGYEVVLTADQVDEETVLAVVRNGEAMDDPDNLVQLVQNTEFSTTWVKGVARIVVQ